MQFTNETIGEVVSFEWDFQGDGQVDSLDTSPYVFTYENAGLFLAQLKAIGPFASSEARVEITVSEPIAPPTAHFIVSVEDLAVAFTSTATGEGLRYSWDFRRWEHINRKGSSPYLSGGRKLYRYSWRIQ